MKIKDIKDLVKVREEYKYDCNLFYKDILRIINYKSKTENDNQNILDLMSLLNDNQKNYIFVELLDKKLFFYTNILINLSKIDINSYRIQMYCERQLDKTSDFDCRIYYLVKNGFTYENVYYIKGMDDNYNKKHEIEFERKKLRLNIYYREMKIYKLKNKLKKKDFGNK